MCVCERLIVDPPAQEADQSSVSPRLGGGEEEEEDSGEEGRQGPHSLWGNRTSVTHGI